MDYTKKVWKDFYKKFYGIETDFINKIPGETDDSIYVFPGVDEISLEQAVKVLVGIEEELSLASIRSLLKQGGTFDEESHLEKAEELMISRMFPKPPEAEPVFYNVRNYKGSYYLKIAGKKTVPFEIVSKNYQIRFDDLPDNNKSLNLREVIIFTTLFKYLEGSTGPVTIPVLGKPTSQRKNYFFPHGLTALGSYHKDDSGGWFIPWVDTTLKIKVLNLFESTKQVGTQDFNHFYIDIESVHKIE
ncbi:MAG: hypothetical protein OEX08_03460 [Candidatus Nomurabacteria bacterium]|nr:hypothetical protein [Candidatus Nomurabacteria bacterium]